MADDSIVYTSEALRNLATEVGSDRIVRGADYPFPWTSIFVFIILVHERRRIVHSHSIEHPTTIWAAQQIVTAFPWDSGPRYLLQDQDSVYRVTFQHRIKSGGPA